MPPAGQCTQSPQLGEECRYSSSGVAPCPLGQFCNLDTGLCAVRKYLGESCSSEVECYSESCGADGTCNAPLECEEG
jgi:hypothetical protein